MGLPDYNKGLGALLFWLEEAEHCDSWPQLLLELGQGGGDRLVELIRQLNHEPRAWPEDRPGGATEATFVPTHQEPESGPAGATT